MTTANQTATAALTCTAANRGMLLPCPLCGCEEATVDLNLAVDPLDPAEEPFHCQECDSCFSAGLLKTLIARWSRLLSWLDSMPGDGGD